MAIIVLLTIGPAAACGGGSDDASSDTTTSTAPTTTLVLRIKGHGTAKIGDESFEFDVASCEVSRDGFSLTAAASEPAVVVNSEEGLISINRGGSKYATTHAEVTISSDQLVARGASEIEAGIPAPAGGGVMLEVVATCE